MKRPLFSHENKIEMTETIILLSFWKTYKLSTKDRTSWDVQQKNVHVTTIIHYVLTFKQRGHLLHKPSFSFSCHLYNFKHKAIEKKKG